MQKALHQKKRYKNSLCSDSRINFQLKIIVLGKSMLYNVLQEFHCIFSFKPWSLREHVEQHSCHIGLVATAQSEEKIKILGLSLT